MKKPTAVHSASTGGEDWRLRPDQLAKVANHLNHVFKFLYERAPTMTAAEWKSTQVQEVTKDLEEAVVRAIQVLCRVCEARGISSAPLAELGTKWLTLWRLHRHVRSVAKHIREVMPEEWVIERLAATTQRLQRQAEVEMDRRTEKHRSDAARGTPIPTRSIGDPRYPDSKWILLVDAAREYGIPVTNLHRWKHTLPDTDRGETEPRRRVVLRRSALRKLLEDRKRKGR